MVIREMRLIRWSTLVNRCMNGTEKATMISMGHASPFEEVGFYFHLNSEAAQQHGCPFIDKGFLCLIKATFCY